ncbi:hypothetical protein [Piscinibacter sakaiensis]|uniref:hypothetical protein n=1 Tax=Piscinibacter sakaiensis TaxID=1547922 RepID=UPI003AAF9FFE
MRKDVERIWERLAAAATACGLLLVLAFGWQPARAADDALAILTIVDGPAQLLRGDKRLRAEEGLRLLSQDIIETTADARVTRIEYPDGAAFNLGPSTRVLIDPQFYGERGRFARLYLLAGWIKMKAVGAGTDAAGRSIPLLASPAIDVIDADGSLVVQVDDAAVALFIESGSATFHERRDAKPVGEHRRLAAGQFLGRPQQGKSTLGGRAAPEFIAALPRSFLDTLPDRAALFASRKPVAKEIGDIGYDDARDWLAVEWTLRRPAMKRWQPLTRDAEFRNALIANMKAHPEWARVLSRGR